MATSHNDEDIEKSLEYYNSKVRPIRFQEGDLVLLKIHNFLGKNRKLAETFKGPFIVLKVNENSAVKIKTKYAKHNQLVNQNLLVKYKQQNEQQNPEKEQKKEQKEHMQSPFLRERGWRPSYYEQMS